MSAGRGSGRSGVKPRLSANGLVTSDRNEFMAWVPACAVPVPDSPEICVSAFARSGGDRLKRFRNPSESKPPLPTEVSIAFATARWLIVADGGNREATSGTPVGPRAPPTPPAPIRSHNVIVLESSVTAPVPAHAAPQVILEPVSSVMLACARMSPANDVVVPSVAELPTLQNTLPPCAPFNSETTDALAVVSVLAILKIKTEFGLPRPFRLSTPVNCADELKL